VPLGEFELAVHIIALAREPGGVRAYECIRGIWSGCRDRLGMTQPIPDAGVPPDLPSGWSSASGIVAAAQRPGADVFQVILRCEDGVFALSAILSPKNTAAGWAELDALWDLASGGLPPEVIGECRLFMAKAVRPAFRAAAGQLRPGVPLWDHGTRTRDEIVIGEVSPRDDPRVARRLVLLARPGHDAELSAWAWSRGDLTATPFTRYLIHASKLRYQLRVWADGEEPRKLRGDINTAVDNLVTLLPAGAADVVAPADEEIVAAAGRITALLAREAGVVVTATRLREMLRTIEITRSNMSAAVSRQVPAGRAVTLFSDDRELAAWLESRISDDIAYLDAARDRARDVTSFADQVMQRIARERQDGARKRQEKLTVLQTAITGSILMALTAIQALGDHPAVSPRAAPALIAFLASATLALSTRVFGVLLIGRSLALSGLDILAWGATAATATWLAISLIGEAKIGSLNATATTIMIAVAAFAVTVAAYLAATRRH
jgi:hypothetical protein